VMERLLEEISFSAGDIAAEKKSITIDATYVETHLGALSQDEDLSRFIL
jgi:ATP-dependent HslUV protease ATP-binding subunit HslU